MIDEFGEQTFGQPAYADGDIIILGSETTGLPQAWHDRWPDRTVTLAELAGLREMARAAAVGCGVEPNYFVNTRVYRAQRDQLRRRVLTRVPGVRAAWSIAGSAKRAVIDKLKSAGLVTVAQ